MLQEHLLYFINRDTLKLWNILDKTAGYLVSFLHENMQSPLGKM